uniref:Uncharacterized protein n=1 Tax=Arundo donax TaxID=35708 RepID=A0A0A9EJ03_ARUDO
MAEDPMVYAPMSAFCTCCFDSIGKPYHADKYSTVFEY